MQEVKDRISFLTPPEYSDKYGVPVETVKYWCRTGQIKAFKTEGGHWHIKDTPEDSVPREEYDKLKSEKDALEATVAAIRKIAN